MRPYPFRTPAPAATAEALMRCSELVFCATRDAYAQQSGGSESLLCSLRCTLHAEPTKVTYDIPRRAGPIASLPRLLVCPSA